MGGNFPCKTHSVADSCNLGSLLLPQNLLWNSWANVGLQETYITHPSSLISDRDLFDMRKPLFFVIWLALECHFLITSTPTIHTRTFWTGLLPATTLYYNGGLSIILTHTNLPPSAGTFQCYCSLCHCMLSMPSTLFCIFCTLFVFQQGCREACVLLLLRRSLLLQQPPTFQFTSSASLTC